MSECFRVTYANIEEESTEEIIIGNLEYLKNYKRYELIWKIDNGKSE